MKIHWKIDWKSTRLPESDSGGKQQHKTESILSLPPTLLAKEGVRVLLLWGGGLFYLQLGRTLSDLLVVGCGEGSSQFELVMGGVLSLGLAAGGPLQTLKKEQGTEKRPGDNGITSRARYLVPRLQ